METNPLPVLDTMLAFGPLLVFDALLVFDSVLVLDLLLMDKVSMRVFRDPRPSAVRTEDVLETNEVSLVDEVESSVAEVVKELLVESATGLIDGDVCRVLNSAMDCEYDPCIATEPVPPYVLCPRSFDGLLMDAPEYVLELSSDGVCKVCGVLVDAVVAC